MNTLLKKVPAHASGMTLIESIVVVLMMIAAIMVVFMGARAWKKDADRTACINNIRNVQLLVRSFQNLHSLPTQAPISIRKELFGPQKQPRSEPLCPASGHYEYSSTIPPVGALAITCSFSTKDAHHPLSQKGW